ncbi:hypothetical protein ABPG74_018884 [Tetrahymena malaccensis]
MFRENNDIGSCSNSRIIKQKHQQSNQLKQAGRSALNSASYAKDNISNAYSSTTGQSSVIEDTPYITAKAWCIYDAKTGQYQRGHHTNEIREMASLTKMATLLVSLRLVERFKLDPTQLYFSVSENAANTKGTTSRLEENEWVLVKDLFYGLMLPSGNDSAVVLAENFGCLLYFDSIGQNKVFQEIHSVDVTEDIYVRDYMKLFLKEMNGICEEFNLKSTKFNNPHGLVNKHNYSTCNDLARLTYFCLKNEEFRKIVATKTYRAVVKYVQFDNKVIERSILWENTNKLLDRGFKGVKTGITAAAGACLSSWYTQTIDEYSKEECNIIIIVLGSVNQEQRFQDTIRLADWYVQRLKDKIYESNYY